LLAVLLSAIQQRDKAILALLCNCRLRRSEA